MAELKTTRTGASVGDFLSAIPDERRRAEATLLDQLMRRATGLAPEMWGADLVGYGSYRYRYASGRSGEWFLTGFSPRKANLTIYIMSGFDHHRDLLDRLGPHKLGKSCLYVKRLNDVDQQVLEDLVRRSIAQPPSAS